MNIRTRIVLAIFTTLILGSWGFFFYGKALSGWINPEKRVNAHSVVLDEGDRYELLLQSLSYNNSEAWSHDGPWDHMNHYEMGLDNRLYVKRSGDAWGDWLANFMTRAVRGDFMIRLINDPDYLTNMQKLADFENWPIYENHPGRYHGLKLVYETPMKPEDWDYWSHVGRVNVDPEATLVIGSPDGQLKPHELLHLQDWKRLRLNLSGKGTRDWTLLKKSREMGDRLTHLHLHLVHEDIVDAETLIPSYIAKDQRPLKIGINGQLNQLTLSQTHRSYLAIQLIPEDETTIEKLIIWGYALHHLDDFGGVNIAELVLEKIDFKPEFLDSLTKTKVRAEDIFRSKLASKVTIKEIRPEQQLPLLRAMALSEYRVSNWGVLNLHLTGKSSPEIRQALSQIPARRLVVYANHELKDFNLSEFTSAKASFLELHFESTIPVLYLDEWRWPEEEETPTIKFNRVLLDMKQLDWIKNHPRLEMLELKGSIKSMKNFNFDPPSEYMIWNGDVMIKLKAKHKPVVSTTQPEKN